MPMEIALQLSTNFKSKKKMNLKIRQQLRIEIFDLLWLIANGLHSMNFIVWNHYSRDI